MPPLRAQARPRLVVVSGASSGIGAAVARVLSGAGRPLLLLSRRAQALEALGLQETMGEALDVTDEDAVRAAVDKAEHAFGPVDAIVNCAGVMHLGEFAGQSCAAWRETVEVNVLGLMITTRAVLTGMIERGGGTIVNISSLAGRRGFADHVAYCASKFAVEGLSAALRTEVARHGVRVTVLAPGIVQTDLGRRESTAEAWARHEASTRSLDGALTPRDVAAAVLQVIELPPGQCVHELVLSHAREP
ncbi:MAG: SDR family oxidoreductase [Acidimicrobiales bacterium]